MFAPPSGYPPARDCDHAIPLLPGASPFLVRPYRYPLDVKDEIERQISDMLQSGIIQHSNSPLFFISVASQEKGRYLLLLR